VAGSTVANKLACDCTQNRGKLHQCNVFFVINILPTKKSFNFTLLLAGNKDHCCQEEKNRSKPLFLVGNL